MRLHVLGVLALAACPAAALGRGSEVVRGDGKVTSRRRELSLAGGRLSAVVEGSGDIRWRGETKAEAIAVHGSGQISRRK